jgi:hypothetical protein
MMEALVMALDKNTTDLIESVAQDIVTATQTTKTSYPVNGIHIKMDIRVKIFEDILSYIDRWAVKKVNERLVLSFGSDSEPKPIPHNLGDVKKRAIANVQGALDDYSNECIETHREKICIRIAEAFKGKPQTSVVIDKNSAIPDDVVQVIEERGYIVKRREMDQSIIITLNSDSDQHVETPQ